MLPGVFPVIHLLRLHQPTGVFFLFMPCWWGLSLGAQGVPPFSMVVLLLVGAFSMRCGGCIFNDWADRSLDALVERTKNRPLACGALTGWHAMVVGGLCGLLALGVVVFFNKQTVCLSVISLGLVACYPFMKRFTYWPQLFLGFTFNWGVLVGWSVLCPGEWKDSVGVLYSVGVLWTLYYDTVYGYQDYAQDQKANIKSLCLLLGFGGRPLVFFKICHGLIVGLLGVLCVMEGLGLCSWVAVGGVALHFCWQQRALCVSCPKSCHRIFKSNVWVGTLIGVACMARF